MPKEMYMKAFRAYKVGADTGSTDILLDGDTTENHSRTAVYLFPESGQ